MKTLVFQSYRASNVPGWISTCLDSVRRWASTRGFQYAFVGDEIFQPLPQRFRERVNDNVVPMSDLARLLAAKSFLADGFERVVWVDADVIVFDAERFQVPQEPFALCREIWTYRNREGQLVGDSRVNNCVAQFSRGNPFLDYYIYACNQIANHGSAQIHKTTFGTAFLTSHYAILRFPLITSVGMLSPLLMSALATRTMDGFGDFLARHFQYRLGAANLCGSFRNMKIGGLAMDDALYEAAIASLLEQRGEILNRYLQPTSSD